MSWARELIESRLQNARENLDTVDKSLKRITGKEDFKTKPQDVRGKIVAVREPPPLVTNVIVRNRSGIAARLNQPPSIKRSAVSSRVKPDRYDSDDEDDDVLPGGQVKSNVAVEKKEVAPAPTERVLNDDVTKQRGKRFFGHLIGTLQSFQNVESAQKASDVVTRRATLEAKVDNAAKKDKVEAAVERRELFREKQSREEEIQQLHNKMDRAQMLEDWEKAMMATKGNIMTSARPPIFYRPKQFNSKLSDLRAKTGKYIDDLITERGEEIRLELHILPSEEVLLKKEEDDEEDLMKDRRAAETNGDINSSGKVTNGSAESLDDELQEPVIDEDIENLLSGGTGAKQQVSPVASATIASTVELSDSKDAVKKRVYRTRRESPKRAAIVSRKKSKSPERKNRPRRKVSRSPIRRVSKSPVKRRSKSPIKRQGRRSKSPIRKSGTSNDRGSKRQQKESSPKSRITTAKKDAYTKPELEKSSPNRVGARSTAKKGQNKDEVKPVSRKSRSTSGRRQRKDSSSSGSSRSSSSGQRNKKPLSSPSPGKKLNSPSKSDEKPLSKYSNTFGAQLEALKKEKLQAVGDYDVSLSNTDESQLVPPGTEPSPIKDSLCVVAPVTTTESLTSMPLTASPSEDFVIEGKPAVLPQAASHSPLKTSKLAFTSINPSLLPMDHENLTFKITATNELTPAPVIIAPLQPPPAFPHVSVVPSVQTETLGHSVESQALNTVIDDVPNQVAESNVAPEHSTEVAVIGGEAVNKAPVVAKKDNSRRKGRSGSSGSDRGVKRPDRSRDRHRHRRSPHRRRHGSRKRSGGRRHRGSSRNVASHSRRRGGGRGSSRERRRRAAPRRGKRSSATPPRNRRRRDHSSSSSSSGSSGSESSSGSSSTSPSPKKSKP